MTVPGGGSYNTDLRRGGYRGEALPAVFPARILQRGVQSRIHQRTSGRHPGS